MRRVISASISSVPGSRVDGCTNVSRSERRRSKSSRWRASAAGSPSRSTSSAPASKARAAVGVVRSAEDHRRDDAGVRVALEPDARLEDGRTNGAAGRAGVEDHRAGASAKGERHERIGRIDEDRAECPRLESTGGAWPAAPSSPWRRGWRSTGPQCPTRMDGWSQRLAFTTASPRRSA